MSISVGTGPPLPLDPKEAVGGSAKSLVNRDKVMKRLAGRSGFDGDPTLSARRSRGTIAADSATVGTEDSLLT